MKKIDRAITRLERKIRQYENFEPTAESRSYHAGIVVGY